MKPRKVIVTGGAGFIGSHIATALVERGDEVHIVDDLSFGDKTKIPNGATLHTVDIRNREELEPIFEGADTIFHLAAIASVPLSLEDPERVCLVNAQGTICVLEAAKRMLVRRVVYSASSAA